MKKGKALCFSSYHLPSIPTDIYRIFILKHPLFISLSLSFSTSRSLSLSLSPSLCLSPDWDLQSSRLTSSGRRSRQPPYNHTYTHTLGTCNTRRARWEQKERYAAREKRRGSVRTYASVQSCISVKACLPEYVCVYSMSCMVNEGFYLGDCKPLDHL